MGSDRYLLAQIQSLNAAKADAVQLHAKLADSAPLKAKLEERIVGYDQRITELLGGPENSYATLRRLKRVKREEDEAREKAAKEHYKATQWERDIDGIGKGLSLIIVAGLISLITYFIADPGGSYVIMTGALVIGGLFMAKGILRFGWILTLLIIDRIFRPQRVADPATKE